MILTVGMGAFAQDAQQDSGSGTRSEFYVVQIPIERVFAHTKGYIVEYRQTPLVNKKIYIPMEWFVPATGENKGTARKGEIILMGTGALWPHISVYYKDGVVDHVRLYVRRDGHHFTWGYVNPAENIDAHFENITDLKIEYK
jgi:hypothetical protein